MKSTKDYIEEHKYILSIPRVSESISYPKKVVGWSLFGLLKLHMRSSLSFLIRYPKALYDSGQFLRATFRLKGTAKQQKALLIGNGPSQGYLDSKKLDDFVAAGGETICVNFWADNKELASHVPTWIVLSDPETLSIDAANGGTLLKYITDHPSIRLAVPSNWLRTLKNYELENKVFVFIDIELTVSRNIKPMFPRGYLSMTLYKALAWAIHLGYREVGVIGMDNTYPRNIYNDIDNKVCNLEVHAGAIDYLVDLSPAYYNVAARIDDLTRLFHHLEYFPNENVLNLDPFSLTDRFLKSDLDVFLTQRD